MRFKEMINKNKTRCKYFKTSIKRFVVYCSVIQLFSYSLFITPCSAQYYDVGEDPSWIKWKQIDTRYFTIIYPSALDSVAKRYAWLFDQTTEKVAEPLEVKLKKTPVILHAYNMYSNGVVTWAPKRMELYTTPPGESYPQLWDKQLVLHETRHIAQMYKMGDNVIKYLHWFFGEQAEGMFVGIFIPSWYLEGDAVMAETALSSSGRGRTPSFLMREKAYMLTGMCFSWDTWKMGSYRYPVPNHYELGYTLSAQAVLQSGYNVMGRSLNFSTRRLYAIPPFDVALGKYAGGGEQELQRDGFAVLKEQWQREDSLRGNDISLFPLTAASADYTAYHSPVAIGNGRVVTLQSTMNHSLRLVVIDSAGAVKILRAMGQINSQLTYHNGFIYWSEIVPHHRWPQQSYSQIYCYKLNSGKLYTLTRKTRFSGVSISSDGKQLVTVENSPEGISQLVVIPLLSESLSPRLALNETIYILTPTGGVWKQAVWGDGDEMSPQLYATLLSDEGVGIYTIDPTSWKNKQLLAPRFNDIKQLTWWNNRLIFVSGYNGTDNIYALSPSTCEIHRLTNARFGAFSPTFDENSPTLFYSDYHAYGYRIVKALTDNLYWKPEAFTQPYRYAWADQLSDTAEFNIDEIKVPHIDSLHYQSRPYNKLCNLFRFHSWAPLCLDPDELKSLHLDNITTAIALGATIFTQNSLNTAIGRLAYKYANGFHSGHLAFTYKGWFPVIDFKFNINERNSIQYVDLQIVNDTLRGHYGYTGIPFISSSIRLYVPFNFSRNGWVRGLIPQVEGLFINDRYYVKNNNSTYYNHYLLGGLSWYERLPIAARGLYPRWGYMLRSYYLWAPFQQIGSGYVGSVDLTTYLPGLWRNHGLQLKAGFQWQQVEDEGYYLPDLLPPPRGYPRISSKQMVTFSIEYGLPLVYPDWNISWLVYFKRVQLKLFSDYARLVRYPDTKIKETSVGFDLLADYHIFRFDFPVQTGIRCAFPLTHGLRPEISLLMNISFN
ncbi:MAG: hypothetical protein LBH91_01190 [Prevotellaceae bacterium]|jgi:hypothetical protein|nr:hypothetical protein [Prevotellaceae bacterium]